MKNRYFDENSLHVLFRVRSWRLTNALISDRPAVSPSRHQRWMAAYQHTHPYIEVLIALQGKTVYGINNRIYPCVPGSIFIIDPNLPHDRRYPPWSPSINHLWITFVQGKAMAWLMSGYQHIRTKCNISCLLDLKDTALWQEGVSSLFHRGQPLELIRLRLIAALADIVAALVEEGFRETTADQHHLFQREKIEAICRHIQKTSGMNATLSNLARITGYSKFHFLRLFRRYAGQSVRAYVNRVRLRKVKSLLAHGLAYKAIAAELGFSCPAAFSRWYRPFRDKS